MSIHKTLNPDVPSGTTENQSTESNKLQREQELLRRIAELEGELRSGPAAQPGAAGAGQEPFFSSQASDREAHLQFALESAQIGDWELDIATRRVRHSPRSEACFGISESLGEWTLEKFFSRLAPDEQIRVRTLFEQSLSSHSRLDFESQVIWPDGSRHWVAVQANVDVVGSAPGRMHGMIRDITARKRNEAEICASAETLIQIVRIQQEIVRANLSPREMMQLMAVRTQEVTGATAGVVELINGPDLVYAACSGAVADRVGFRVRREASFSGLVVSTGSALYCQDSECDPRVDRAACRTIGVRSMIVAPVRVDKEVVGALKVLSDKPFAFSKRDLNSLQILVQTLGVVMQNQRVAEALRSSVEEMRMLAEVMPQIVWATTAEGKATYMNSQWTAYTGLTAEESFGDGWTKPFHPEDRPRAWEAWNKAVAEVGGYSLECRLRRFDGAFRWWLIRGEPFRDDRGRVLKWFGTCTDIHDLKVAELEISRRNRALKMLSRTNEALIHADAEQELLAEVCRIAVELGGYRMVWVGFAEDDATRTIRPVAFAGEEQGYFREIRLSWSEADPAGSGPGGRAIRSGRPVICPDVSVPGENMHWRENALRREYRSLICLPLRDASRTFGLLSFHASEIHSPGADEMKLLQELADDLAFGITTVRARAERQRVDTAIRKMAASVAASATENFFEQLAGNMAEALGAEGAFIARNSAGEAPRFETIALVVQGRKAENFEFSLTGSAWEQLTAQRICVALSAREFGGTEALAQFQADSYVGRSLVDSLGHTLGVLFVFFRSAIKESEFITSTLQIFAVRAAAELSRQQADQQLRFQASLLDKATDAIIVRDLDTRVVFWSKGAERAYGWTSAEAIGRSTLDFLAPEPASFMAALEAVRNKGEWTGELKKTTRSGSLITVDCRWALIKTEQGQPKAVLSIETDVTEKKQLEAQILRAQRMDSLGTLAGGIAHDLNNVLAPILMSIELLKLDLPEGEAAETLQTLQSSAQHGTELVKQVLSFARGVEGKRIAVNLAHLLRGLRAMVRDTFPKNIAFDLLVPANISPVLGDPTQLHQVFTNFCVNARDAMPNGGRISISLENTFLDETYAAMESEVAPGPYVLVAISDSGTGIPKNVQEKIFEPFFTTKEVGKGTGLGLSTALGIVRSHGGFIQVKSTVGLGSCFTVYIPALTRESETGSAEAENVPLRRGNGELVLLVDDDNSVRRVAQSTLQRFGYRVKTAENGAEAVSIYAQEPTSFAVVLTDIAMPIMDGLALAVALRALNPDVKIIASSGNAPSETLSLTGTHQFQRFVTKPYTAEALLTILHEVLSQ